MIQQIAPQADIHHPTILIKIPVCTPNFTVILAIYSATIEVETNIENITKPKSNFKH